MQFLRTGLSFAILTGSALAQLTQILAPAPGSTLTAGSQTTVQIGMGNSAENVDEVVLVIGLASCESNGSCPTASQSLGSVLYQGSFDPTSTTSGVFYQNFTVTVPSSVPAGKASLNVAHLFLIGDAEVPTIDYLNEAVTVVS